MSPNSSNSGPRYFSYWRQRLVDVCRSAVYLSDTCRLYRPVNVVKIKAILVPFQPQVRNNLLRLSFDIGYVVLVSPSNITPGNSARQYFIRSQ